METLLQDLRHAVRSLVNHPGFTVVAVLTLALGIGANTAIFSVVNAVVLRPLAFRNPGELVVLWEAVNHSRAGVTAPDFVDWQAQSHSFAGFAASASTSVNLTGAGEAERLPTQRVSAGYFPTLGVAAAIGRTFLPEEAAFGAARVTVLSDGLWRRRFGADTAILGKTITLGDDPYTVIGVLPPGFGINETATQLWLPLALTPEEQQSTGSHLLTVFARLKPGHTRGSAQTEMSAIAASLGRERPGSNQGVTVRVDALQDAVVSGSRSSLLLMFGAVGFVLLIACVNVANLFLARAAERQREMSIRAALGAGAPRLLRQLLSESLTLALTGGTLGLLLAIAGTRLLIDLLPPGTPRLDLVGIDGRVLGFTLLTALLTGVAFGLVPARQASHPDLHEALKESGRSLVAVVRPRLRRALVIGEIAIALVLLVGSGLVLKSFLLLRRVDPGFDPRRLLTAHVSLPEGRYGVPARTVEFYQQVLQRVRDLPGARAAALTSFLPLDETGYSFSLHLPDRPAPRPDQTPVAYVRTVSPDYRTVIGFRLVRGRDLTDHDRAGTPRVALINETMVHRLWPTHDPLGKTFTMDDGEIAPIEVVGVVSDVKHFGLGTESRSELFVPFAQAPPHFWEWTDRSMTIVMRTTDAPATLMGDIRAAVGSVDKSIPLYRATTMDAILAESLATERSSALLLGMFATVALGLAALGLYGLMAYLTTRRAHEVGIRLALGASTTDVLHLVVGEGLNLVTAGLTIGLGGAVLLTRVLGSLLFGVTATDPATFAAVAALVATVALVASYVPARRAARLDPVAALRSE
jgi:putative ABC transport system permease protein